MCELFLENAFVRNGLTLLGDERAQATAFRAAAEVGFGFLTSDGVHSAFDANLTLEFGPVEDECRMWIFAQFMPLVAAIIAVEDKPTLRNLFEKHNASGRAAARAGCGQRHGVWFFEL